jgi:hypothetical protein
MIAWLRRRLGGGGAAAAVDSAGMLPAAAMRFATWAARVAPTPDAAIDQLLAGGRPPGEAMAGDLAAWVGEQARARHGGEWAEEGDFGLVLRGCGDVAAARLHVAAVAERKLERGPAFSLAAFLDTLGPRLEAERTRENTPGPDPAALMAMLHTGDPNDAARAIAEQFRAYWRRRHPVALPLTLTGVRELDGFLRSHYLLSTLDAGRLAEAGFFLGEVTRGLFGGVWVADGAAEPADVALRWPELDYFPVGRVFRMMLARPAGEPLDEYVRLVPSARAELRKAAPPGG